MFTPNRHFKREYDRIFRRDPRAANLYLLLCELADDAGRVMPSEAELAVLLSARFDNLTAYHLKGGLKL